MNSPTKNDPGSAAISPAEETLRLIARLPVPEALVSRVQAGLRARQMQAAEQSRWSRPWWLHRWIDSTALRAAAAAIIVAIVAGGGWQIYSHVQPAQEPEAVTVPARVGNGGGFSSAGAMRTPDTLKGPVLTKASVPDAGTDHSAAASHKTARPHKSRKTPKLAPPAPPSR